MIIDEKDYLEHFGVKGMKWGSRTKRPSTRKVKSFVNSDVERRRKTMSVGRRMANRLLDDLDIPGRENRRTKRMTKEQLAWENRPTAKAGKLAVAALLAANGGLTLAALRM